MRRRLLVWAGAGALLASSALAGSGGAITMRLVADQQGTTVVVDDDLKECPQATFTDLRAAALAAPPGATILVCPGVYPGPVVVTRPITFIAATSGDRQGEGQDNGQGDGSAGARNRSTTDSSREAIVMAGPLGDGFSLVANSAGTTIDGFVITGGVQPIFDAGIDVRDPVGTGYRILDNLITNNNVGMYFHSIGGAQSLIAGNAFVANNAGGFPSPNSGTAIFTQLQSINDTEITRNYFEGQTDSAMNLGDGSQHGLVIDHNTSVNNSTTLVLGRATGTVVSHNQSKGTYQSDLYLFGQNNGVWIEHNQLSGATSAYSGIRLTGPYFGAVGFNANLHIANNRIRGFGYGIRGSNVTASTFDSNDVQDNAIDGIQMSPVDVDFTPAVGNTLTNNTAHKNGVWDCEDDSRGPGTAGTGNYWIDDQGETSNPPGICHGGEKDH